MYGLIAEEVAKVNPDLVVRNAKGKPETVRFESINAMLLNEFLKEHRKGGRMIGSHRGAATKGTGESSLRSSKSRPRKSRKVSAPA